VIGHSQSTLLDKDQQEQYSLFAIVRSIVIIARVAGNFVDNLWERGHPARLRPGMAALHQQKLRAPLLLWWQSPLFVYQVQRPSLHFIINPS